MQKRTISETFLALSSIQTEYLLRGYHTREKVQQRVSGSFFADSTFECQTEIKNSSTLILISERFLYDIQLWIGALSRTLEITIKIYSFYGFREK